MGGGLSYFDPRGGRGLELSSRARASARPHVVIPTEDNLPRAVIPSAKRVGGLVVLIVIPSDERSEESRDLRLAVGPPPGVLKRGRVMFVTEPA